MANRRDEGSILKELKNGKHTGRWFARLRYTDIAGKRCEKKRTCRTQVEAKSAIRILRAEIDGEREQKEKPHVLTYNDLDVFYRREYVHEAVISGGKVRSGFRQRLSNVEHYLDRALDFFADIPIDMIGYEHARKYKIFIQSLKLQNRPRDHVRSDSDVHHHLKRVRRVFNVAVQQGWMKENPFSRGDALIVESFEVDRTRTLSHTEETTLLEQCVGRRSHLNPLIIFAVETACRLGEIRKLRWADVDIKRRVIKIIATNTKTLEERLVPVSGRLARELAKLRQNQLRPNSLVFDTGDPKRASRSACREAKLDDVHFHDLRHTAITRMLVEKRLPRDIVMKISGHHQEKTFMRYVNTSLESIYEISLMLDRVA